MRRIIFSFFWFIAVLVSIFLALGNWHYGMISLHPFSPYVRDVHFSAPMFILLSGGFFLGVIFGSFVMWIYQRRWRILARSRKRDLASLRREYSQYNAPIEKNAILPYSHTDTS